MSKTQEPQADQLTMDNDSRLKEQKAIDATKAGIKGLVDAGVVDLPKIFIKPLDEIPASTTTPQEAVPVVDLSGMDVEDGCKKIVAEITEASEKWGIFQLINHGVPSYVLDGMIDGTRKFHEQDVELKKQYYSCDPRARRVRYGCSIGVDPPHIASWRDTLYIPKLISGDPIEPEEIPAVCRETSLEYINHVVKLGETLFGILSEALGLKPGHLKAMACAKGQTLACHYYPACPQPELTLGTDAHTDPVFLTILLQDQLGGLQVMHNNQWVDVEPIEGGLVINIGDLLQILSNDKFTSVTHKVLAQKVGPRMSVACYFTGVVAAPNIYGPIKELISKEKPPVFKEFTVSDYLTKFYSRTLGYKHGTDRFRI